MFIDSRVRDGERTASTFKQAFDQYQAKAESWFDGTPHSIDRRLAQCDRLLHSTRTTVARMTTSQAQPYLRAAEHLQSDREALASLREDLLTGGAGRADVTGPPGWTRSAGTWYTGEDPDPFGTGVNPNDFSSREEFLMNNNLRSYTQDAEAHNPVQPGEYDPSIGDYAVKPTNQSSSGYGEKPRVTGYPQAYSPMTPYKPRTLQYPEPRSKGKDARLHQAGDGISTVDETPGGSPYDSHGTAGEREHLNDGPQPVQLDVLPGMSGASRAKSGPSGDIGEGPSAFNEVLGPSAEGKPKPTPTLTTEPGMSSIKDAIDPPAPPKVPTLASLSPQDRRWVTLEATKFVTANTDTLDDSHELATRAHHHARMVTSTFSGQRSAAVSRAFVAQVTDLGRRMYRPTIHREAAISDVGPDEAFWL